jgi:RNA-directed DNA polymerase
MGPKRKYFIYTNKSHFEKTRICTINEGFQYLGFYFHNVTRNGKLRIKITPSPKNNKRILEKISQTIDFHKSSSAGTLIRELKPIIQGWGNYFKYCECSDTFSKLSNLIHQKIRAWVFRRQGKKNRTDTKNKYFPPDKTFTFYGKKHQDNWTLCGTEKTKTRRRELFLPKLTRISSKKKRQSSRYPLSI